MNAPHRKQTTPEIILDTAQSLIMSHGFHGVSVDRIIEAAGVSKGSFFYHFKSKEALAVRLLERFFDHQIKGIERCISLAKAENDSDTAILMAIIDNIVASMRAANSEKSGCIMASFSYQIMEEIPELKSISDARLSSWSAIFDPYFEAFLSENEPSTCDDMIQKHLASAALSQDSPSSASELSKMFFCILQGSHIIMRVSTTWSDLDRQVALFKLLLSTLKK